MDRIIQRLRARRESTKTSIRALAAETGFSPSTICKYEQGRMQPSLTNLHIWADALGYDLDLKSRTRRKVKSAA